MSNGYTVNPKTCYESTNIKMLCCYSKHGHKSTGNKIKSRHQLGPPEFTEVLRWKGKGGWLSKW